MGAGPGPPPARAGLWSAASCSALPSSKAQGRAFKCQTRRGRAADGGAGEERGAHLPGARPSPSGFQDQGHCAGRKGEGEEEVKEEVQGSFWYQGRKTLWEEVVCRGCCFCSAGENVFYSDGSLPPEGRHGGCVGATGVLGCGALWGEALEPPALCMLLSRSWSREGRGAWLRPRSPTLHPYPGHPEVWLDPSSGYSLELGLRFSWFPPPRSSPPPSPGFWAEARCPSSGEPVFPNVLLHSPGPASWAPGDRRVQG